MTTPPTGPVVIPPPGSVRVAAVVVALEGVGLLVLAALSLSSGLSHGADLAQLFAEVAYFVVIAAALVFVSAGLLRGRRWARTPAIVVQVVVIAVGMWTAFPSGQLRWGLITIVVGAATLALLVTPSANQWIKLFPRPFGPGPNR